MKAFFRNLLASIMGFFISLFLLFGLFIIIAIAAGSGKKEVVIKNKSILRLTFSEPIPERPASNPLEGYNFLSREFSTKTSLPEIVESIHEAKTDDKIKGIFMDLGMVNAGFATLEEIRLALLDFKKSGKFLYSYGEYFNNRSYYLASVSDSIFLNKVGVFNFAGFHSEQMFLKGTLEKMDVQVKLIRAGKFKSAGETFIRSNMSDENRLQLETFINSSYDDFLKKIGDSRKMAPERLRTIANNLEIRTPSDAVRLGLVSKICYYDQVLNTLKKLTDVELNKNLNFTDLAEYNKSLDKEPGGGGKDKIALIYAVGEIMGGEGSNEQIGSDKLSESIRKARLDDKVKAIVLRINSPGGSALASDIIWREVVLAKQKKPVIVSMGDLAASGGYYIAAPADMVFAEPNTLTGSIGVFALIPSLKKFWEKDLGITWDRAKTGKYADLGNPNRDMLPEEEAIFQTYIDTTYREFKDRVAEGRHLRISFVDSIAQGRIYSGLQAKELGLVDKLGNLNDAIAFAAQKAGITKYHLKVLPDYSGWKYLFRNLSNAKDEMIKSELKENYVVVKKAQSVLHYQGVQMIFPYDVTVY